MKDKHERLEELLEKAKDMTKEEYRELYKRTRDNPHFDTDDIDDCDIHVIIDGKDYFTGETCEELGIPNEIENEILEGTNTEDSVIRNFRITALEEKMKYKGN